MNPCELGFQEHTVQWMSPEAEKNNKRLVDLIARIKDPSDAGKIIRLGLKLRPSLGGAIDHDIASWIMLNTGVDLKADHGAPLTSGDLTLLESKIARIEKIIGKMHGMKDQSQVRGMMKKLWYLPHENFHRNIIGGDDLWAATSAEDARRNDRMEQMTERLVGLENVLTDILGLDAAKASKEMGKLEAELARTSSNRQAIEAARRKGDSTYSDAEYDKARREESTAATALKIHREGLSKNLAGQLFDDLADALMGKFGEPKLAHRVISEKWGKKIRSSRLKDAIGQSVRFLEDYGKMAEAATEKARRNVELELIHDRGFGAEEAADLASKLVEFTKLDHYYPRQNLLNASILQKSINSIRNAASKQEVRDIVKAHIANPVKQRSLDHPGMISRNIVPVLKAYAEDVIYMDYHNSIGVHVNEFIGGLKESRSRIKNDSWHAYVDATIREVIDHANEMTYAREAGIGQSAVRTLVAMKAAQTMGFLNFSTPLLNAAEGRAHAIMKHGFWRIGEINQRKQMYDGELKQILEGEFTRMSTSDLLGDRPQPTNLRAIASIFTPEELKRYHDIEMSTIQRWADRTADLTSKGATKVLGLQRKAEDGNRKAAFEAGAADEYDFIKTRFKHLFDSGQAPEWILRQYRISSETMSTQEGRDRAWEQFAKARVSRAGYDFMYQTQWQYNFAARHVIEKWSPGNIPVGRMLMMFQHYPLNWIASYRMGFEQMRMVAETSGWRALFDPTSKDMTKGRMLGKHVNSDTIYKMSVGAAHLTNQAMRYFSPVIFGMLFSHPVAELVGDLLEYSTADDEERRKAMYGKGLMNQLLGPHYTDFTDHVMPAIGAAVNAYMFDTGSLPEYLTELMRATTGADWTPRGMEEYEQRGLYQNTKNMVEEVFLWDALAITPKWSRIGKDVKAMDIDALGWDLLKLTGVRPNWDAKRSKEDKDERRRM